MDDLVRAPPRPRLHLVRQRDRARARRQEVRASTFAGVPIDKATEYAAEDADVTLRLWMALKPRLAAERMTTVYETLERPLMPVIVDMERAGIKVDRADPLAAVVAASRRRWRGSRRRSSALAGDKFNLGSPQAARRIAVRPAEAARRQADQDRPVGDARRPARRSRGQRGAARRRAPARSTRCSSGGS